jgi:sterol desaturase/sphingolipid hydroxylase (fatty acid hydroxylase superfamily)
MSTLRPYFLREVTNPHATNYFFALLAVSAAVYGLELWRPWRREQPRIRRDFFLDAWYMFFNFFGFGLLGYAAVASATEALFRDALAAVNVRSLTLVDLSGWPLPAQVGAFFVLRDFVQWNIHRLLHRVDRLWELHKVHHSVQQMGFAAHLRYHWAETVVYRTLEYIPLALMGLGVTQLFAAHFIALTIGHLNHANTVLPMGPLKYVLNNSRMHIWHHARQLPRRFGANFGISLSIWDYLFATAYVPRDGCQEPLGFEHVESFPQTFWRQITHPWLSGPRAQANGR